METEVRLWSLAVFGQHNGVFSMRYALRLKRELMITRVNVEYRRFGYVDCIYPR